MKTRTPRISLTFAVVVASIFAIFGFATGAQAHSDEFESTPANGATVSEVSSLSFTFVEPVEQSFPVELSLVNETSEAFELGAPTFNATGETMTVAITGGALPNGSYTAAYRVTSADGHPASGTVMFTVSAGGSSPAPTQDQGQATPSIEPRDGNLADDHSAVPISAVLGADDTQEFPVATVVITAASVAGLALIIAAVILVIRRKSKKQ